MNELAIKSPNIKATQYGIEFTGNPSIKEWYQAVQAVQRVNGMCQWYLGDLIVYAESPVTGWGESKYEDLLEATGYEYSTLAGFAKVARRFSPEIREAVLEKDLRTYANVSFGHFERVAPLSDEKALYFLEMVRDGGWSVAKLREEIARYKNGGTLPKPREEEVEELPDGWAELKQSHSVGYVPAPQSVKESGQEMYLIELTEWELKRLRKDYANDSRMLSLCHRIDTALRR